MENQTTTNRLAIDSDADANADTVVSAGKNHSSDFKVSPTRIPVVRTAVRDGEVHGVVHINIGDGGNREGHYDYWLPGVVPSEPPPPPPQQQQQRQQLQQQRQQQQQQRQPPHPSWSAFRRAEFGHGKLQLLVSEARSDSDCTLHG